MEESPLPPDPRPLSGRPEGRGVSSPLITYLVMLGLAFLLVAGCNVAPPDTSPPRDQPSLEPLPVPTCDPSRYRWAALSGAENPATTETDAVRAFAVYDDGTGPALYVGGNFTSIGGIEAHNIARYDGHAFTALGPGVNAPVLALAEWNDADGSSLYVGGEFTQAGGIDAHFIARWNGEAWSALGESGCAELTRDDCLAAQGVPQARGGTCAETACPNTPVEACCLSLFSQSDECENLTRDDCLAGNGLPQGADTRCDTVVCTDPPREACCLPTGACTDASRSSCRIVGGVPHGASAGCGDLDCAAPTTEACCLASGSCQNLPAGACMAADGVALGPGTACEEASCPAAPLAACCISRALNGPVSTFAVLDIGSGPRLYLGGAFRQSGALEINAVAAWDGRLFRPLGTGVDGVVLDLVAFDDGRGPALYAAGAFVTAGGKIANGIARWDGREWSSLGGGLSSAALTLAVFEDQQGPALYVGGAFFRAGDVEAPFLARWDGEAFSPLGAGVDGQVNALLAFDDGDGPDLYAGGEFTHADQTDAAHIARWSPTREWSPLAAGLQGRLLTIGLFDNGSEIALYAGGILTTASGLPVQNLARWTCFPPPEMPMGGTSDSTGP